METLTFDQLPQAVQQLQNKLESIEQLLIRDKTVRSTPEKDILNLSEAADFLNLKKPTVYSKISRNELPHMKKGNRLYFSRKELVKYIKAGKRQTATEAIENAHKNLTQK